MVTRIVPGTGQCILYQFNVSYLILQNARNESHSVSSPKAYTPSGLKIVYLIMLSWSNTWILLWNLDISKLIQIIRRFAKSCVKVRFFWFESLRASIIRFYEIRILLLSNFVFFSNNFFLSNPSLSPLETRIHHPLFILKIHLSWLFVCFVYK